MLQGGQKSFFARCLFLHSTTRVRNYFFVIRERKRPQTRPVEVLRTRRHTGRRPSFLSVGWAITGFINFTTIIYRVSAMDRAIEPMGPKIRLWPCEPEGRIRAGRWRFSGHVVTRAVGPPVPRLGWQ